MTLPTHLLNPTRRMLRQFSVGWLVLFVGYGAYQCAWPARWPLGLGLAAAGLVGGLLGWRWPAAWRWVFAGWMLLAFPIGWLVSQLVLAVMFYGIITPLALVFRLRGRDRLARGKTGAASFWLPREQPADVRRYFQQY